MHNVRGSKLKHKEEEKNESIGTIEYAINHPNVFIRASSDWLYYKDMLVINIYGEIILIRDIKWLI